jgi:hypothetical protein
MSALSLPCCHDDSVWVHPNVAAACRRIRPRASRVLRLLYCLVVCLGLGGRRLSSRHGRPRGRRSRAHWCRARVVLASRRQLMFSDDGSYLNAQRKESGSEKSRTCPATQNCRGSQCLIIVWKTQILTTSCMNASRFGRRARSRHLSRYQLQV